MKTTKTAATQRDPSDAITDAVLGFVWLALKGVARLGWWALLFPMLSIPLGGTVTVWLLFGWPAGVVVGLLGVALLVGWRVVFPATFARWVTDRVRFRFLAWLRYRCRWVRMLSACGLQVTYGEHTATPRLIGVRVGEFTDRVTLRMLPGQCPEDYSNRTAHLAHAFGVLECRTTIVGPSMVELGFRHHDSLAEPVTLPPTQVEWLWDQKEAA